MAKYAETSLIAVKITAGMTQKSCFLGKGYSVIDNLYNKDVSSRSTCSRRKSKAAPCGEYVSFGTVPDWSL